MISSWSASVDLPAPSIGAEKHSIYNHMMHRGWVSIQPLSGKQVARQPCWACAGRQVAAGKLESYRGQCAR